MAKKKVQQEPAQSAFVECQKCRYAGEEENHMRYCSVLNIKRSSMKRKCIHYKQK